MRQVPGEFAAWQKELLIGTIAELSDCVDPMIVASTLARAEELAVDDTETVFSHVQDYFGPDVDIEGAYMRHDGPVGFGLLAANALGSIIFAEGMLADNLTRPISSCGVVS